MTEAVPQPDAPQTRAHDGRTMIGHVVVCRDDGMLAVWHVNTAGNNTGAWVVSTSALTDPEVARRLLSHCAQRALTAWNPGTAIPVLGELEKTAEVAARDWAATAVSVPEILTTIAVFRAECDKRIAEERQLKKNIVPAEWEVEIPDRLPSTADELRQYARLARIPGTPAVEEALLTAALLRWSRLRWKENMTVVGRREYLQRSLGQPRLLPVEWETRLADACAGSTRRTGAPGR